MLRSPYLHSTGEYKEGGIGAEQSRVLGLSTGDRRGLGIIKRASPRRGRSHTIDAASAMRDLPTHDDSTQSIHPYLTTATPDARTLHYFRALPQFSNSYLLPST